MTNASAPSRFLENLRDAIRQTPWMAPVAFLATSVAAHWLIPALKAAQWKNPLLIGLGIGLILVNLGIFYLTSVRLIGAPRTLRSFWRYSATTLLLLLPMLGAVVLLLLARETDISGFFFAALVLIIPTAIFVPMLLGWPLLQATSLRVIGPREAFRRSRGIRWSVLVLAFILGGLPRLSLASSWTDNLFLGGLAFAIALAIEVLGRMITVAAGVAAYKHLIGD